MRILRSSSIEEYTCWYLRREGKKGDSQSIPIKSLEQIKIMLENHKGKMRDWFNASTRWQLIEIETAKELANLIFLESPWTIDEGLVINKGQNYRLLGRIAMNALDCKYMARPSAGKHKYYYDMIASGTMQLNSDNRIAICSAEPSEIENNPSAQYYLLDGVGRCLPYMILLLEKKIQFTPIEAFLAERGNA
jgi:hypothetical protein